MDMVYYVTDLFKPPVGEKKQMVKGDDPFISMATLKHYSSTDNFAKGVDTALTLGADFFKEANKIQSGREIICLAQEAAKRKVEEEKLSEERIVKKQLDEKVDKVFSSYKRFVKRSCPVKIPYKSQLTHEEHAHYLVAFLKYKTRPPKSSLEKQEYQIYLSLQNRVFEEQQALIELSKKVSKVRLPAYNEVSTVIEEYMTRYLKHGFSRVLDYPCLYHLEQEIPLRPQDPNNTFANLTFEHAGHLLSVGVVPYIKLPYRNAIIFFPSDTNFLTEYPPDKAPQPKQIKPEFAEQTFLNKTTVSMDPNCSFLAGQHQASIVITPSAVKTLLDNPAPNFDKEWDIPVVIRTVPVTEPDGTVVQHRVVFIDKPIKKKLWTPLEKKALFYKKSGLSTITSYRKNPLFRMKIPDGFSQARYKNGSMKAQHYDYDTPFNSYEPSVPSSSYEPSVPSSSYEPSVPSSSYEPSVPSNSYEPSVPSSSYLPSKPSSSSPNRADKETAANQNTVSTVSGNNQRSCQDSVFDDPFNISEVNQMEVEEFGVDQKTFPFRNSQINTNRETKNKNGKRKFGNNSCSTLKSDYSEAPMKKATIKSETVKDTISCSNNSKADNSCEGKPTSETVTKASNILDDILGEEVSPSKAPALLPTKAKEDSKPQTSFSSGRHVGEEADQDGPPSSGIKVPWSKVLKTDWTGHDKPRVPMGGTTTNYHYHLFNLHSPSTTAAPSHTVLPPITVLVRYHLHGISMENVNKGVPMESAPYVLVPKLENQLYFGCEVNTHTEIMQQWTELLMRPNTNVLQVRLCPGNGEVVLGDRRDLSEVLREGHKPHIRFQPSTSLTSLYATLNSLKRMAPGRYLLHHPNKSEAFIRLMKSVDEEKHHCGHQSTFNLHASYGYRSSQFAAADDTSAQIDVIDSRQYTSPPWLAIDTNVPTAFHYMHKKIPATFPMANPERRLSSKKKRAINDRCKTKLGFFDLPDEAQKAKDNATPNGNNFTPNRTNFNPNRKKTW